MSSIDDTIERNRDLFKNDEERQFCRDAYELMYYIDFGILSVVLISLLMGVVAVYTGSILLGVLIVGTVITIVGWLGIRLHRLFS
jgi:hypothetical protein